MIIEKGPNLESSGEEEKLVKFWVAEHGLKTRINDQTENA